MLEKDPNGRAGVPGEPTRLVPVTLSDTPRDETTTGSTINGTVDGATGEQSSRVDLLRVLTGLRHLRGCSEPGRVFSELAGVCVPALCDEAVITIEEAGGHRYRIRQPATTQPSAAESSSTTAVQPLSPTGADSADSPGPVRVAVDVVQAVVSSVPGGGPDYTATVRCSWRTGYRPTDADVALVGVLAEHAAGVVHRERTMGRLTDRTAARQVGVALDGAQRIAAATGVLMALHHVTVAQARHLLDRASDRTHRSLQQVADTVLHTGSLTEPRQHQQNGATVTDKTKTCCRVTGLTNDKSHSRD